MTEGTRKITSKNPQEVDERKNPSLLNRPYRRWSLEAGLLRLRAARTRTCPHVGNWDGGGSPSLVTRHTRAVRGRAPTCGWAATARLAIARAALRMRLPARLRTRSCARGKERRRGWLAGGSCVLRTRRRVAREKRARVAAELVALVQRDAPRCACARAPTPLPLTTYLLRGAGGGGGPDMPPTPPPPRLASAKTRSPRAQLVRR